MSKHKGLEPRVRDVLSAGVIMCGLLSGCAVTPDAIRGLPELPSEFAKDLAVARTAPVLMTKPAATAPTLEPRPAGPIFAIARACTAIYEGYVLYPIAVCYPPTALYGTLDVGAVEAPAPADRTAALPVRYFKLSSHPQARIGGPWFCVVRSGPWFGHVEGQQICGVDPNVRLFKADILGAPEPMVVFWSGTLNDVPPPLNLLGIAQTKEFCVCCSGIMCPNGTCKPDLQYCDVMPPAVK